MRQAGAGVSVWVWTGLIAAGLSLLTAGCASQKKAAPEGCVEVPPGCVKPLIITAPAVTPEMLATPSSAFVDAADVPAAVAVRPWGPMVSYYAPQVVKHGPLYFEDEMEVVGPVTSECPAGLTWLDLASIPYSDARWMLNTIALPISMVVNPPWQRMCSDGVASKRPPLDLMVDAIPCPEPVPTPFDLKCPEQQAEIMAELTGGPVASTATPATQPAQ